MCHEIIVINAFVNMITTLFNAWKLMSVLGQSVENTKPHTANRNRITKDSMVNNMKSKFFMYKFFILLRQFVWNKTKNKKNGAKKSLLILFFLCLFYLYRLRSLIVFKTTDIFLFLAVLHTEFVKHRLICFRIRLNEQENRDGKITIE